MERKTFKALTFWASRDVLPDVVRDAISHFGSSGCYTFEVPTEVVLTGGRQTVPCTQARAWMYFRHLGMKHSEDGRSSWSVHNSLVEVWEDWGDDGHTEYMLVGYAEMAEKDAQEYIKTCWALERNYEFPQIEHDD